MVYNINILLVEDNPGDVRLIQEMLLDTDFSGSTILVANKLNESIKKDIFNKNIALVLLDLTLPDSDGMNSIQSILRYFSNSALIVLTGMNNEQLAIDALREGAQNYLVKGEIDSKILEKSIRYSLEQHNVILKLKQAHNELKENRYFLEKAQEVAHIGHWVSDMDENGLAIWSEETQRIFGLGAGGFDGKSKTFFRMIYADDLSSVVHAFAEAIVKKKRFDLEYRIVRPDENICWVHCQADVIRDEKENPLKIVGVIRDISVQKNAEIERTEILNDLILRNKDLEQFAYIVSHNLRAPVANIMGITDILNNERFNDEEKKTFMEGLTLSVKKLDEVVMDLNHILQVKREINDKKEIVYFSELVNNIKASINYLIEQEGAIIETDFSKVKKISTLKIYLYSIFYNLINNSIKFRQPHIPPVIQIKSGIENDRIVLRFKDNGLGIDMAKKSGQVFGLYKRFHTHIEGKGLGLFMVKTQVEVLGGKIIISSELNKGTEFTILL